jgi:hypothetical protein
MLPAAATFSGFIFMIVSADGFENPATFARYVRDY